MCLLCIVSAVRSHNIGDTVTLHCVRGVGGDALEQLVDIQVMLEEETTKQAAAGVPS